MNHTEKHQIKTLTANKISLAGSQNKYARSIDVSEAQLSNLMNDRFDKISKEMWRKLADACGFTSEQWLYVNTKPFMLFMQLLQDAKEYSNVYAVVAPAGSGKSGTIREYTNSTPDVFKLECAAYWNKRTFLMELLRSMAVNSDGMNTYEMMEAIQVELLKRDNPLIIMDEADKLSDEVLYFFITLYNKLSGKCGLVMCATEFLQRRIDKGVRLMKKGYAEIKSRIGGRCIVLPTPGSKCITNVCVENGLTDDSMIEQVVKESYGDLRIVERLVHKFRRQQNKKEAQV